MIIERSSANIWADGLFLYLKAIKIREIGDTILEEKI